jgi:hypothetical protein
MHAQLTAWDADAALSGRRTKRKNIKKVVVKFNEKEVGFVDKPSINAGVRKSTALDRRLNAAAEALHRKCPGAPDGTRCLDIVGNVQKGMDRDWAQSEAGRLVLIVHSVTR